VIHVAKFQELQASLVAAQRQARDLQTDNAQLDTKVSEATDQLEMIALDREVAEEKAEAAEAEVVKLGERLSEMELEIAILKEENGRFNKTLLSRS
jgi:dynactin 1